MHQRHEKHEKFEVILSLKSKLKSKVFKNITQIKHEIKQN